MIRKIFLRIILIFISFLLTFIFLQYRGVRKEVIHNRENKVISKGNILKLGIESSSGLIKSENRKDFYWTHDDSVDYGEAPKTYILGFKFDGEKIETPEKVIIEGVRNIDWEDIGRDKTGKLIIGDIGNNVNRKDYMIYRFEEPKLGEKIVKKENVEEIMFRFPGDVEYNNESLFYGDNSFYILTKEYGKVKLFRLPEDKIDARRSNIADYIGEFEFIGSSKLANFMDAATGADISKDEKIMAFTTYKGIFLFKRDQKNTNFFDGEVFYLPLEWDFRKYQYEAIAFTEDDKKLILTSEQGEIYEVKINDFEKIRDSQPTKVFKDEAVEVGQDRQGIVYKIKHGIYLFQVLIMNIIFR